MVLLRLNNISHNLPRMPRNPNSQLDKKQSRLETDKNNTQTRSYKLFIRYEAQFCFDIGLWIMATSITVSTLLVAVSFEREKHYISKMIQSCVSLEERA